MIEILLLTILVFAFSGYVALWVRGRRRSRALPKGRVQPRLESPVKLPTKEEIYRKTEEEWLYQYAMSLTGSEKANVERVWNDYVEKQRPRTREERERLHRNFMVKVARLKLKRELEEN